jgi:hypothetical protein
MKKLPILFLFLLIPVFIFADTSGTGCKIGEGYIYTDYLGIGYPYTGQPGVRYYNSNGAKIPFYWGYGQNLHRGYRCGYINIYGASSYYDDQTGQTVQIPAENEITAWLGENCIIAASLTGSIVGQDSYVAYTYNKTNKCSTPPQNVPIDDNIWLIIIGIALVGAFFLSSYSLSLQSLFNKLP